MKRSFVKNSQSSINMNQNSKKFSATQGNPNQTPNINEKVEEEYINNLQKKIYYLELEMKLMKDKEIDTKNKVGGYGIYNLNKEILFRDGVPLNEHFLALKTKYQNEKGKFEQFIYELSEEIKNLQEENKGIIDENLLTDKNYLDLIDRYNNNNDYYKNKIIEINAKLANELHVKANIIHDRQYNIRKLNTLKSDNVHFKRTVEKNKLFKENFEEKQRSLMEKNQEKLNDIDRKVVTSLLEKDVIERKLENNSKQKIIENDNVQLINQINKLERDTKMAQAKISELENTKELNRKYLFDSELEKRIHEKENIKLNEDLDNLSKLTEDSLRVKVKENERSQSIIIQNKAANNEFKVNSLLDRYKAEEVKAKELLEEKNVIHQKILSVNEDIGQQSEKEKEISLNIIDCRNNIYDKKNQIEDEQLICMNVVQENEFLRKENDKLELEIKTIIKKIEEIQQKIELNNILKDVDINELKMLTQNNSIVNNSINVLMNKWEKVHSKLLEMESNNK